MKKSIVLCGQKVEYELTRKNVKNINLRIRRDGSIGVSASGRVPQRVIEDFLLSKDGYIIAALEGFAAQAESAPTPRAYEEGEPVWLFGERLSLSVTEGPQNRAERRGGRLILSLKRPEDMELRKKTLELWLRSQCMERMTEICRKIYPLFAPDIPFPQLKFRAMRSRWGSCMPQKGTVTFNTALAEVPPECMEYVAMHEFTHFLQPDHSPEFYRKLENFMPDWRERKKLLSNCAGLLQ